MIITTSDTIRRPRQRVYVDGSRDSRFWCTMIRQASHAGLAEAEFVVPEFAADAVTDRLRDAAIRVSVDGSGETHFAGYLAVDSGNLTPTDDGVVLRAYTITRWLQRYHVGQFTQQWEVTYPVVDKVTGLLTGWTPALILMHLFSQLPEEVTDKLKLGDIGVLHDLSSVGTPDITFRLTDYASAINQLIGLVGDVAFRERFAGDVTYLDFYRVNAPSRDKVSVRHASWNGQADRPNVQSSQGTSDTTNVVDRVIGHGAYRQFMITSRSAVVDLPAVSEPSPAAQLIPLWDSRLEPLLLKSPSTGTGERRLTLMTLENVTDTATAFTVDDGFDYVPVGALLTSPAGEIMRVTGYTPKSETASAFVSVLRAQKETTATAMEQNEVLQLDVPGLEFVFRRYRLPAALNACTIMRHGCLLDSAGEPYPQCQAFKYEALRVEHDDDGEGHKWVEGVLPTHILQAVPDTVRASLDVDARTVTFAKPALTFLAKKPARDSGGSVIVDDYGSTLYETTYRPTVVGVTLTVENQAYPFGYDTGARPVTGFDFNTAGFSERFQKNDFQYWQLGTGAMPIAGVDFPCIYFPVDAGEDGSTLDAGYYLAPGTAQVSRNDIVAIRSVCEQILREKNRRARNWNVVIPWFAAGYKVGQEITIGGLDNFPWDTYKITSVEHDMPITGECATTLQIDNIKPPVRHKVRAVR